MGATTRTNREKTEERPATDDESGSALLDRLGGCDQGIELADFRISVRPLLARLPEREQTVLKLRFWDGWTQSRIAERIGVSQMHVSRLLAATLARLRDELEDRDAPGWTDGRAGRAGLTNPPWGVLRPGRDPPQGVNGEARAAEDECDQQDEAEDEHGSPLPMVERGLSASACAPSGPVHTWSRSTRAPGPGGRSGPGRRQRRRVARSSAMVGPASAG
ncbi:sigma-70 family RNA polymerase sigma factor [Kitasatospora sp. NPDC058444]|uniref:sigma-70 family RNA polymerase sigma factor n=1 Tax=Kitasatospora sp. NPDC058444 TaxID=3346504 RepID=UPI00364D789F